MKQWQLNWLVAGICIIGLLFLASSSEVATYWAIKLTKGTINTFFGLLFLIVIYLLPFVLGAATREFIPKLDDISLDTKDFPWFIKMLIWIFLGIVVGVVWIFLTPFLLGWPTWLNVVHVFFGWTVPQDGYMQIGWAFLAFIEFVIGYAIHYGVENQ